MVRPSTSSRLPAPFSTTAGLLAPSRKQQPKANSSLRDITDNYTSQHYNKKLRLLAPATLEEGTSTPGTPVRSATKRKAPTPKKVANASASPTPGAENGRKKKVTSKAASEEAVMERDDGNDEESPAKKAKVDESGREKKKVASEVVSEKAVAERNAEDDDDEQTLVKTAKVDESEDQD
jgi:hypothetical protein